MRQTAATARLIDIKGTSLCRRYVMAVPLRTRGGIKARESDMTASPAELFLKPLRCALCGGSMLARLMRALNLPKKKLPNDHPGTRCDRTGHSAGNQNYWCWARGFFRA